MAAFTKIQSFVEAVAHKKHDLETDVLQIALCNAANAPVNTNNVLADLTQIAYTNLSSQVITTTSSGHTGGLYTLILTDLDLTASGGAVAPFRYPVIFNQTAASDELIGFYDYGSDLTLADGEDITIDFDGTNGVLTIE